MKMKVLCFLVMFAGCGSFCFAQSTGKMLEKPSDKAYREALQEIQKNRVEVYKKIEKKFSDCSTKCIIEDARRKDVISTLAQLEEQRQSAFAKVKITMADQLKLQKIDVKYFEMKRKMLNSILPGQCLAAIGEKMLNELAMPIVN
jgi:hypothetical protein